MENKSKLLLNIIGTHGIPARYGGFETLADFLSQNLNNYYDITVYCNSNKYESRIKEYCGVKLKYLKIDASGFQGILFDFITLIHALFTSDIILYLSPVGSGFITPLTKLFYRKKIIINHGGLNEWDRPKLNYFQQKFAKMNHLIASQFSDVNVVDNDEYKKSLKQNFNADSVIIRYGGDHVRAIRRDDERFLEKYSFLPGKYAVSVSRAQVDNNLHLVLEAFSSFNSLPLVLISNWEISSYGRDLKKKYQNAEHVFLLDAIYDKDELDYVRSNSYYYIHSHSFCGTAPSLVEAMNLGKSIFSFDVPTNRETTKGKAFYFSNERELTNLLVSKTHDDIKLNGAVMKEIALSEYSWLKISNQYKQLIDSLYSDYK